MIGFQPAYGKNDNQKNKHKNLPPGLQKKVKQGKPLPPGWQKKLIKGQIMALEVYHHGQVIHPVDELGIVTIRIDVRVVRIHKATREIIEILK